MEECIQCNEWEHRSWSANLSEASMEGFMKRYVQADIPDRKWYFRQREYYVKMQNNTNYSENYK